MIVDCHTQIWGSLDQLGRATPMVSPPVQADETRHLEAVEPVDYAFVLAFKSRHLDAEIPNRFVGEYVRRHGEKLIGFASIDPNERDWLEDLRLAQDELHLRGVVISPELQDFHPSDTRAMRLYEQCEQRQLPVLFEHDHRVPGGKMEFANPVLLDEVAQEFPDLRIVIGRLGEPWIAQTLVLLSKHQHAYADLAGLLNRPWQSYTALLAAYEQGVTHKLLFGSGFPFRSPAAGIEALYSINQISHGTNLQPIPRGQLRGIVERDALQLLRIQHNEVPVQHGSQAIFADDE